MTEPRTDKPARKRPTRKQLEERLAIPLGPKGSTLTGSRAVPDVQTVDPAARQRARDRAGD